MIIPRRITISLIALLVANSIILLALLLGFFSEKELFITFTIEGAIICFYNYLKITSKKSFNLDRFFLSSLLNKEKDDRKNVISFFQLNYIVFIMANLTLLMMIIFAEEIDFQSYFYASLLSLSFLISHGMSFKLNFFIEERNTTLNSLFFAPYKRFGVIILALYAGFLFGSPAMLLVSAKILLDVFFHLWERRNFGKKQSAPEQMM
ncbi:hypothetical protein KKB10_03965 [Patescibacteria group bacterium]|nr:hypothetical protein [Patescibacteria group bacterium]MBU1952284.1 hypothetical protein [Patescibacteria group bacterium]